MALLHETETISFVFLLKIHCFDNWRLLFIEAENRVAHIDGIFTKLLCLVVVEIHLEAHIRAESSRISSIDSLSLIIYENVELSLFLSLSLSHSQLSLSFPVVFFALPSCLLLLSQFFSLFLFYTNIFLFLFSLSLLLLCLQFLSLLFLASLFFFYFLSSSLLLLLSFQHLLLLFLAFLLKLVVFSIIERVIELIIRLLIEWNVALVCFIINKVTFLTLSIINHKIIWKWCVSVLFLRIGSH